MDKGLQPGRWGKVQGHSVDKWRMAIVCLGTGQRKVKVAEEKDWEAECDKRWLIIIYCKTSISIPSFYLLKWQNIYMGQAFNSFQTKLLRKIKNTMKLFTETSINISIKLGYWRTCQFQIINLTYLQQRQSAMLVDVEQWTSHDNTKNLGSLRSLVYHVRKSKCIILWCLS